MAEQSDVEKAEEEAASWVILLEDDPNDAEQKDEFEQWLGESKINAEAWGRTQRAYDLIGQTTPRMQHHWDKNFKPAIPGSEIQSQPANIPPKLIESFSWIRGLTLFAATAIVVIMLMPTITLHFNADYMTGTAEQRSFTLSDGSQITLAPESAISVDFVRNQRRVRLIKGQAYFDVTPDVSSPFSVEAADTIATVLGTQFVVSLDDSSTTVSVAEGRVRVEDDSINPMVSEELLMGDRLSVTRQLSAVRSQISTDEIAPWRNNEVIARDMPIEELVDILGTYHKGTIIIRASSFDQQRVTGLYRLDDPTATLNNLAASYGATVKQISPWVLVVTD